MDFGFVLPNNWGLPDPAPIVELAVEAEAAGLNSVWVNHHILNIGYIADRLDDRPYYDALTVLSWAGAATSTIRLGTSVLVVPYLHPMATAKALATIDQLSGGRVIAGLGVGSLREENEALGVSFNDRGQRANEFIDVMLELWSDGPANFQGEHYQARDLIASPKPAQADLEVWIGGSGAAAQNRAVHYGHGWHPLCSLAGLVRRMPAFLEALDAGGRTRADVIVAPRVDVADVAAPGAVEAWAEAGADQLIVHTSTPDIDDIRRSLHTVAKLANG